MNFGGWSKLIPEFIRVYSSQDLSHWAEHRLAAWHHGDPSSVSKLSQVAWYNRRNKRKFQKLHKCESAQLAQSSNRRISHPCLASRWFMIFGHHTCSHGSKWGNQSTHHLSFQGFSHCGVIENWVPQNPVVWHLIFLIKILTWWYIHSMFKHTHKYWKLLVGYPHDILTKLH